MSWFSRTYHTADEIQRTYTSSVNDVRTSSLHDYKDMCTLQCGRTTQLHLYTKVFRPWILCMSLTCTADFNLPHLYLARHIYWTPFIISRKNWQKRHKQMQTIGLLFYKNCIILHYMLYFVWFAVQLRVSTFIKRICRSMYVCMHYTYNKYIYTRTITDSHY